MSVWFFLQLNISFKTLGPLFFWCPPILYRLPTTNSPGRILGHQLESWYNRILAQQKLSFRMSEGKGFFVESWNPNVSGNNLLHLRDFFMSKSPSVVGFNYLWVFGFQRCNFFYKTNYSNVKIYLYINLFQLSTAGKYDDFPMMNISY